MNRIFGIVQKGISKRIQYNLRYTKQYFQDLNIDRQQIKRNEKIQAQKNKKQQIKSIISNDRNPNNFIKNLKIDHQVFSHSQKIEENYRVKQCAIINPQPKKDPILFSVNKYHILTTLKKATLAMKPLRKKYLIDAIVLLKQSQKKVSKQMVSTFYHAFRHAIQRNLNPLTLFVHGIIVGKKTRIKGIRYHAKGKGGRQQRDICQIKLIVQQKQQKQFFQNVGSGQGPAGFGDFIRKRLLQINAGYQKLLQVGSITTAKGRQQKRELIKRRTNIIMSQNRKNNTFVPKKLIVKQIKEEQGVKIKQIIDNLKPDDHVPSIKRRQKLFKKNMGVE